jgi:hypothetical protein
MSYIAILSINDRKSFPFFPSLCNWNRGFADCLGWRGLHEDQRVVHQMMCGCGGWRLPGVQMLEEPSGLQKTAKNCSAPNALYALRMSWRCQEIGSFSRIGAESKNPLQSSARQLASCEQLLNKRLCTTFRPRSRGVPASLGPGLRTGLLLTPFATLPPQDSQDDRPCNQ